MNRRAFCLALSSAGVGLAARAQASDPLLGAVEGAQRSAKNRVRDPFRHPAQTLAFWGLAPGMTVIEIDPGGGYWTEILGPYLLQTHGHYIAAVTGNLDAFKARFADPSVWAAIETTSFDMTSGPLAPAGGADMVIAARTIHDWLHTPGFVEKALADFHAALKPGGILAVEEHRADPRPMVPDATDGYVSTAWLTAAVQKAGFNLEASSEINANPKDTKDYPFGVWTLPPTRRTSAKDQPTPPGFDPAKYEAIGESDRMTLRFRKL